MVRNPKRARHAGHNARARMDHVLQPHPVTDRIRRGKTVAKSTKRGGTSRGCYQETKDLQRRNPRRLGVPPKLQNAQNHRKLPREHAKPPPDTSRDQTLPS